MPASGPCIFHSDVFVLTVPTKHVGLVMGKGKSKFFEILSSSGLSRLRVPRVVAENDASETEIELEGTDTAVVAGSDMIGRAVQRQVRIGAGPGPPGCSPLIVSGSIQNVVESSPG